MGTRREFMRRTAAGLCAAVTPAALAADSSAAPRGKTTLKRAVPVRYVRLQASGQGAFTAREVEVFPPAPGAPAQGVERLERKSAELR